MSYPILPTQLFTVFLGALILTVLAGGAMLFWPLQTPLTFRGIIDFEFAWSSTRAAEIASAWEQAGFLEYARLSLWVDFLFLLGYSTALSTGCAIVAGALPGGWGEVALWLAWGAWLAGVLDALENLALLRALDQIIRSQSTPDILLQLAACCAAPKFVLVFVCLGYFIIGAAWALSSRVATAG